MFLKKPRPYKAPRVICSSNDAILYDCAAVDYHWTCGRCKRGGIQPVKGAQCTQCPARVVLVCECQP